MVLFRHADRYVSRYGEPLYAICPAMLFKLWLTLQERFHLLMTKP